MIKLTYTNPLGNSVTLDQRGSIFGLLSVTGLGVPEMTIQEQKAPFQHGTTYIDQLLRPRIISTNGKILVGNDLDAMYSKRSELVAVLNPLLGQGALTYFNNGFTRSVICTPQGPVFSNKIASSGHQEFTVSFYCNDPFLYHQLDLTVPIVYSPGRTYVLNIGQYKTPFSCIINGPMTNPGIENATTGEYIKFSVTLASGETIAINTAHGKMSAVFGGARSGNAMGYIIAGSTFYNLAIGSNLMYYSASSATGSVSLTFKNRDVGV